MPFVIIAAVIAIICVARYYHNKKERNKEITWQEVQKQTDTKRNTISIDTSENFSEGEDVPAREVHSRAEHKRKIANTPNRYVVIDLETTGLNPQYDFITEFGAVLVEGSEIVDTFEQLVKPKKRIPEEVEDLTGITNEMVSDAPSINIVLPKFLKFIGNDILVGHNIDFDSQFISAACQRFNLPYKNKVCDTLELSQQVFPKLENHKLSTLCRKLNVTNDSAHRALSDVLATQQVFEKLSEKATPTIHNHAKFTLKKNSYNVRYSAKTKAIRELQEMLLDITDDNILTDEEVMELKDWLDCNEEFCNIYPFDKLKRIIESALEDGILEQHELDEMLEVFNDICKPEFDKDVSSEELINLDGKVLVFTGECQLGDTSEITPIYEAMGATIRTSVSGKTDYLVVGAYGSPDWSYGNYGSEVLKARELQEAGKKVKIINETDFLPIIYSEATT